MAVSSFNYLPQSITYIVFSCALMSVHNECTNYLHDYNEMLYQQQQLHESSIHLTWTMYMVQVRCMDDALIMSFSNEVSISRERGPQNCNHMTPNVNVTRLYTSQMIYHPGASLSEQWMHC